MTGPLAHSENDAGVVHLLFDHLNEVADRAREFADCWGAGELAAYLGWWHDAGKVSEEFQRYLVAEPKPPQGPDHSSVGALHAWEAGPEAKLLAFCLTGHHGGLRDLQDLKDRMSRKAQDSRIRNVLSQAKAFLGDPVSDDSLDSIRRLFSDNSRDGPRRAAFFLRMVHSALVDADCLDTEAHFQPEQADQRIEPPSLAELWERLEKDQTRLQAKSLGTVNEHRRLIYEACLTTAQQPQGFFSLTVPTGGGKTRSGMAFALQHALHHNLSRVIVAIPYTSIIEQNAQVYRDLFGETAVLEHHSALAVPEVPGDESDAERWARLAADNWDARIVVTTTVQFFESLFAAQNSRLRKLHNVARSVIILDEVQTLPTHLLAPTLEALRFLVEDFGCTVVLSSATQPALNAREGFAGLQNVREIVPQPEDYFRALARVRYEVHNAPPWSWEEVAEAIAEQPQCLVVLNTIRDAIALMDTLPCDEVLHLSTRLCAAHRREVLAEVQRRLGTGEPCRLISTQVVEAGVDIDFPVVFRALGPLDRIVQAAGRCNREGKRSEGRAVLFVPAEGGAPRGAYRSGLETAAMMLTENPSLDLHDPEVYQRYFRLFYQGQELDRQGIGEKISRLAFATIASDYRLIEEDTAPVLVRHAPHASQVDALTDKARFFMNRDLLRQMQPYLVSLHRGDLQKAEGLGLLSEVRPGLHLFLGAYDEVRGLELKGLGVEDLVV